MKKVIVLLIILMMITGTAYAQESPSPWDFFGWLIEQLRLFFEWLGGVINALFGLIGQFFEGLLWFFQQIINFFGDLFESIWNWFAGLFEWIFNNLLKPTWDFLVGAVQYVVEWIEIVALLISLLLSFIGIVLRWIWSVGEVAFGIFNVLSNANPSPIPGLPLCVSAPTAHDFCAIWYILANTIFVPGTIGDFILPILILMVDLWIIFYVISAIGKIAEQVKAVFDV